ncbi:MAG: LysM peptidoglycan-binding domain-containing protein [Saprospiraceae bacterium]|nr:LysM peptidoglycan-binding domain-containing protein [Saprospiraceae bacterium]
MSKYQKIVGYGDKDFEADKELSSIMQKEQGEKPVTHSTGEDGMVCAEEWEPGTHIVQKGENLRAIARTYKVPEQQLVKWNQIANPDLIEICQKIWLKPPPASAKQNAPAAQNTAIASKSVVASTGKTVKPQGAAQAQKQKATEPVRPVQHNEEAGYVIETPNKPSTTPRIHTVLRGEYLSKIAKTYGCPEECIRIANNMPMEGDELLEIGQQLIIPECTCTLNGEVLKRKQPEMPASKPALTVKKQTEDEKPVSKPVRKNKVNLDDDPPMMYNYDQEDLAPQKVKKTDLADDSTFQDDEPTKAAANKAKESVPAKKKTDTPKVPLFREHHVKQGETLKSIAAKYKVDAAEISQINGLDPKESLIPGQLILVPIEEE